MIIGKRKHGHDDVFSARNKLYRDANTKRLKVMSKTEQLQTTYAF